MKWAHPPDPAYLELTWQGLCGHTGLWGLHVVRQSQMADMVMLQKVEFGEKQKDTNMKEPGVLNMNWK